MNSNRPPQDSNKRDSDDQGFDSGFDGHRARQARRGLSMTPAERLRWLEETMEEMRWLCGRAKKGRQITDE